MKCKYVTTRTLKQPEVRCDIIPHFSDSYLLAYLHLKCMWKNLNLVLKERMQRSEENDLVLVVNYRESQQRTER